VLIYYFKVTAAKNMVLPNGRLVDGTG